MFPLGDEVLHRHVSSVSSSQTAEEVLSHHRASGLLVISPSLCVISARETSCSHSCKGGGDLLIEWQLFLISHVLTGRDRSCSLCLSSLESGTVPMLLFCEMRTCVEQSWKGDPSRCPLNNAWRDESLIDYIREWKSHRTPLTSLIKSSRTYQHICTNEIHYNLNPVPHQDQYVDSWQ